MCDSSINVGPWSLELVELLRRKYRVSWVAEFCLIHCVNYYADHWHVQTGLCPHMPVTLTICILSFEVEIIKVPLFEARSSIIAK